MAEQYPIPAMPGFDEAIVPAPQNLNLSPVATPLQRQFSEFLAGPATKMALHLTEEQANEQLMAGMEAVRLNQEDWIKLGKQEGITNPYWWKGGYQMSAHQSAIDVVQAADMEWAKLSIDDDLRRDPDGYKSILDRLSQEAVPGLPEDPMAKMSFWKTMDKLGAGKIQSNGEDAINTQITHTIGMGVSAIGDLFRGIDPTSPDALDVLNTSVQTIADELRSNGIPMSSWGDGGRSDGVHDGITDLYLEALLKWNLSPSQFRIIEDSFTDIETTKGAKLSDIPAIANQWSESEPDRKDQWMKLNARSFQGVATGQMANMVALMFSGTRVDWGKELEALAMVEDNLPGGRSTSELGVVVDQMSTNHLLKLGVDAARGGGDMNAAIYDMSTGIDRLINVPVWGRKSHKNLSLEARLDSAYKEMIKAKEGGFLDEYFAGSQEKGFGPFLPDGRINEKYLDMMLLQGTVAAMPSIGENLNQLSTTGDGLGDFLQSTRRLIAANATLGNISPAAIMRESLEQRGEVPASQIMAAAGIGGGSHGLFGTGGEPGVDARIDPTNQVNINYDLLDAIIETTQFQDTWRRWDMDPDDFSQAALERITKAVSDLWNASESVGMNDEDREAIVKARVKERWLLNEEIAVMDVTALTEFFNGHPQQAALTKVFGRQGEWSEEGWNKFSRFAAELALPYDSDQSVMVARMWDMAKEDDAAMKKLMDASMGVVDVVDPLTGETIKETRQVMHPYDALLRQVLGDDLLSPAAQPFSSYNPDITPDNVSLFIHPNGTFQIISKGQAGADAPRLALDGTAAELEDLMVKFATETSGMHEAEYVEGLDISSRRAMSDRHKEAMAGEGQHDKVASVQRMRNKMVRDPQLINQPDRIINGVTYNSPRPLTGRVQAAYGENGKINPILAELLPQLGHDGSDVTGKYGKISSAFRHGVGHYNFYISEVPEGLANAVIDNNMADLALPTISFSFQGRIGRDSIRTRALSYDGNVPGNYTRTYRKMEPDEVAAMFKKAKFDPTGYNILSEDAAEGAPIPVLAPGELRGMHWEIHDTSASTPAQMIDRDEEAELRSYAAEEATSNPRGEDTSMYDIPRPQNADEYWATGVARATRVKTMTSLDRWFNFSLNNSKYNPYTGEEFVQIEEIKPLRGISPLSRDPYAAGWRTSADMGRAIGNKLKQFGRMLSPSYRNRGVEEAEWRRYHEELKPYLEEAIHNYYMANVAESQQPALSPNTAQREIAWVAYLLSDAEQMAVLESLIKAAKKKKKNNGRIILPFERLQWGTNG